MKITEEDAHHVAIISIFNNARLYNDAVTAIQVTKTSLPQDMHIITVVKL